MKNRDIKLSDFLEQIKNIKFNNSEEKEIKEIIAKVRGIKNLTHETKQRDDNYNYFKNLMLPSDYRKINSDYRKQLLYKIERETYKYSLDLKKYSLSEEEIITKIDKYKEDLCKQYGIKGKNKMKTKLIENEDLKLEDLNNIEFEEE